MSFYLDPTQYANVVKYIEGIPGIMTLPAEKIAAALEDSKSKFATYIKNLGIDPAIAAADSGNVKFRDIRDLLKNYKHSGNKLVAPATASSAVSFELKQYLDKFSVFLKAGKDLEKNCC